jgi:D-proline reductase (dithiol) PrdB
MSESTEQPNQETFSQFKNSFAYGSRSDLNFKFLKNLSDEDAATFLQGLLYQLSDAFDKDDFEALYDHVRTCQARAYAGPSRWTYDEGPFTPLVKPLSKARLALLTSSGHFVEGNDPSPFGIENMTQAEATARIDDFLKEEPVLSAIPSDTPAERLCVRHGGYDIRSAERDPNVAFPLTHLRNLVQEGVIGELAPHAYSFVGACAQTPLIKRTGPRWVEMLRSHAVDGVVLVPV